MTDHWVTIDGSVAFNAAVILPTRWNGFACPLFPKETARDIVEWMNTQAQRFPDSATAHWEGEVIVVTDPNYDDEPPERIEPTGAGLYGIGAFSWVWTEVGS